MKMDKVKINLYNGDCMEAMKQMKDNEYDLAIVDPPYGMMGNTYVNVTINKHSKKYWLSLDKKNGISLGARPSKEYFKELKRVSKNWIVWGGQYFVNNLDPHGCVLVWDKKFDNSKQSAVEIAHTSFNSRTNIFRFHISQDYMTKHRIHITQKPVPLYKWVLKNYAKPGQRIIDTHGGSMSIAIACYDMGFDLDLWEIDEDYYKAGVKRFNNHISQISLF